jgi:hypothetical protein
MSGGLPVVVILVAVLTSPLAALTSSGRRIGAVGGRPCPAGPRPATGGDPGGRRHVDLHPALLLALVDAAMRTGAPVPRALEVVGGAVGGADGAVLRRAGSLLELGSGWDEAWAGGTSSVGTVADALRSAWLGGVAPGAALRVAAERVRRERRTAARAAAARLGTHLVLPLGLCFLPSFVLLGLVPVVVSLAGSLLG